MFASLTAGQKVVVALTTVVLAAGLWIGADAGGGPDDAQAREQVMYTLPAGAEAPVTVHVVGAVHRPGVYTLQAGSRVRDAIDLAGGFTDRAKVASVNLAEYLEDGDQVRVEADAPPEPPPAPTAQTMPVEQPPRRSSPELPQQSSAPPPSIAHQSDSASSRAASASPESDLPSFARRPATKRPRLNSGGLEELQQIPGIGPALAKNIIYHRSAHGPFRRFEDLEEVRGIGPATMERIRVSASLR